LAGIAVAVAKEEFGTIDRQSDLKGHGVGRGPIPNYWRSGVVSRTKNGGEL